MVERPKPSVERRLPAGRSVIGYGFFTHENSPVAAIRQLAAHWPELRLALKPQPAD